MVMPGGDCRGQMVMPGEAGDGQVGTCGLRGWKGSFGSGGCSSIVTGGFDIPQGSGHSPRMGSCSVSGSGFSSGSGSCCRTIVKKTVESSRKTSVNLVGRRAQDSNAQEVIREPEKVLSAWGEEKKGGWCDMTAQSKAVVSPKDFYGSKLAEHPCSSLAE
ncbi:hypothetical protein A6R68_16178 [Neotoma lepida]|uniref:Uncharacterized protein n=1 Tax=Neotoma lepida TaxID=56216 RepID=A0A1A6HI77_NEOLE|nr:hypothetical protein A6R68_16178 [Neotoma lepida]